MRTPWAVGLAAIAWGAGVIALWAVTSSREHFAGNLVATYLAAWGLFFLLRPGSAPENAARFGLSSAAFAASFALLELPALMRWVDYRLVFQTPIHAAWKNPAFVRDPELMFVRRPHERLLGTSLGGDIAFLFDAPTASPHAYDGRYDRNGFRNPDSTSSAEIAVIGDSFVEGVLVQRDQLVTSVLSKLREAPVLNLALMGYGPRHQLVLMRRHALPLRPHQVIWVFFEGNDLKNVHDYDRMTAAPEAAFASHHSFVERSFTKNALLALMREVGDPKPSAVPRLAWIRTDTGQRRRIFFLYPGTPISPIDLAALHEMRTILATAERLCAEHGVRLLVAFAPTKFRVYEAIAEQDPDSELGGWVLNDLPSRLGQLVREAAPDAAFVDLTPALVEAAQARQHPFFLDDTHWSPTGHRVVAETLQASLQAAEAGS